MRGYPRVTVHESAVIPAPAGQLWELLCDWAGMLRWWLPAENGGLEGPALVSCELIGTPGSVPRTRRMTLSDETVAEETIIYQNDQTRRIHYTKADDQAITGYAATTYVDDLGEARCEVHICAAFDVSRPAARTAAAARAAATARFAAIYTAMFNGYRQYLTRSAP